MKNMKKIILKTNPKTQTEIYIGHNLKHRFSTYIQSHSYTNVIYIIDEAVAAFSRQYLPEHNGRVFILASGEKEKNFNTVQKIIKFFFENHIDKTSLVVGIGGGVTTDIVGFAASIYYRGIPTVFVSTTLLAQVDAALGGKNAANMAHIKNVLGTIYQPKALFIDTAFLMTLSQRQVATGMAEIIRYALGFDRNLFTLLEQTKTIDEDFLINIIRRSVEIKTAIVEHDYDEKKNIRTLLNLGHTLGHALESQKAYNLTHGEAIAIGMHFAGFISLRHGFISFEELQRIVTVLRTYHLPTTCSFDVKKTMQNMRYDKKKTGDTIQYIILQAIGKAKVIMLDFLQLQRYLEEFLQLHISQLL